MTERSKEILELESQLRDSRQEVTSLSENNKILTDELTDVQARLDSSQVHIHVHKYAYISYTIQDENICRI